MFDALQNFLPRSPLGKVFTDEEILAHLEINSLASHKDFVDAIDEAFPLVSREGMTKYRHTHSLKTGSESSSVEVAMQRMERNMFRRDLKQKLTKQKEDVFACYKSVKNEITPRHNDALKKGVHSGVLIVPLVVSADYAIHHRTAAELVMTMLTDTIIFGALVVSIRTHAAKKRYVTLRTQYASELRKAARTAFLRTEAFEYAYWKSSTWNHGPGPHGKGMDYLTHIRRTIASQSTPT